MTFSEAPLLNNTLLRNLEWEYPNFIHKPVILEQLETQEDNNGRFYKTPNGELYPSITTVLGVQENKSLDAWRNRVGEKEANKISRRAANRGTRIHKLFELYLDNNPDYLKNISFIDKETFIAGAKIIHKNVNNIRVQEGALYSNYMRVGGRVDLVAEYNGKLSIIDFKTSRYIKDKNNITNYFMQTAAYAVMFEELTGIPIAQLVIIIIVDDEMPQIFVEKRDNWIEKFIKVRKLYKSKYDI